MVGIIQINLPCNVKIKSYSLGKEEIGVQLSQKFKVPVYLDDERYKKIRECDYNPDCFTDDCDKTFIFLKGRKSIEQLNDKKTIKFKLSGWNAYKSSVTKRQVTLAYSSHSNF